MLSFWHHGSKAGCAGKHMLCIFILKAKQMSQSTTMEQLFFLRSALRLHLFIAAYFETVPKIKKKKNTLLFIAASFETFEKIEKFHHCDCFFKKSATELIKT